MYGYPKAKAKAKAKSKMPLPKYESDFESDEESEELSPIPHKVKAKGKGVAKVRSSSSSSSSSSSDSDLVPHKVNGGPKKAGAKKAVGKSKRKVETDEEEEEENTDYTELNRCVEAYKQICAKNGKKAEAGNTSEVCTTKTESNTYTRFKELTTLSAWSDDDYMHVMRYIGNYVSRSVYRLERTYVSFEKILDDMGSLIKRMTPTQLYTTFLDRAYISPLRYEYMVIVVFKIYEMYGAGPEAKTIIQSALKEMGNSPTFYNSKITALYGLFIKHKAYYSKPTAYNFKEICTSRSNMISRYVSHIRRLAFESPDFIPIAKDFMSLIIGSDYVAVFDIWHDIKHVLNPAHRKKCVREVLSKMMSGTRYMFSNICKVFIQAQDTEFYNLPKDLKKTIIIMKVFDFFEIDVRNDKICKIIFGCAANPLKLYSNIVRYRSMDRDEMYRNSTDPLEVLVLPMYFFSNILTLIPTADKTSNFDVSKILMYAHLASRLSMRDMFVLFLMGYGDSKIPIYVMKSIPDMDAFIVPDIRRLIFMFENKTYGRNTNHMFDLLRDNKIEPTVQDVSSVLCSMSVTSMKKRIVTSDANVLRCVEDMDKQLAWQNVFITSKPLNKSNAWLGPLFMAIYPGLDDRTKKLFCRKIQKVKDSNTHKGYSSGVTFLFGRIKFFSFRFALKHRPTISYEYMLGYAAFGKIHTIIKLICLFEQYSYLERLIDLNVAMYCTDPMHALWVSNYTSLRDTGYTASGVPGDFTQLRCVLQNPIGSIDPVGSIGSIDPVGSIGSIDPVGSIDSIDSTNVLTDEAFAELVGIKNNRYYSSAKRKKMHEMREKLQKIRGNDAPFKHLSDVSAYDTCLEIQFDPSSVTLHQIVYGKKNDAKGTDSMKFSELSNHLAKKICIKKHEQSLLKSEPNPVPKPRRVALSSESDGDSDSEGESDSDHGQSYETYKGRYTSDDDPPESDDYWKEIKPEDSESSAEFRSSTESESSAEFESFAESD